MADYSITGSYFETCNCDAICPCRMVDGIKGGRSTHGICFGALAWLVEDGHRDEIDLDGLAAVLVVRYDDDEPGSPWTIVLHVDARGTEEQRQALADIFLGDLGGPQVGVLPWVRKERHVVAVRTDAIELTPDGEGYVLRVGDAVRARANRPVPDEAVVRCVIPGYDQPGRELVADEVAVKDDPFEWELAENCAFASRFAYASE